MNIRKHVAGLALFSVILGSAIFLNHYLTIPNVTIPSATFNAPPLLVDKIEKPQPVNYKVRLVSLDFINKESYTALVLKREAGQPAPEKLWVTTVLFSPSRPTGKVLMSNVGILKPFAHGDVLEYVATSPCDWCEYANIPKAGYFARVYVSADYADSSYPPDLDADFDPDITTAIPVVVQAARKTVR
jgi:hypothetical protein